MADEEKRVARTAGVSGEFRVGDLTITPEGTELTLDEWKTVAEAAVVNHVIVRLDEDFTPEQLRKQQATEETDPKLEGVEAVDESQPTDDSATGTTVDQGAAVESQPTPTTAAGRRGAKSGG